MTFEQRLFDGDVEVRDAGDVTTIAGYAVTYNTLSHILGGYRERFEPGAFKRVLSRGDEVQAWYNHDPSQLLGSTASGTLRLKEDERGLRYEVTIDPTDPDHQRVLAKIRRGDLRGSSFGFMAPNGVDWSAGEDGVPVRSVREVAKLRDVGPASRPAYPDTAEAGALALRSIDDAKPALEELEAFKSSLEERESAADSDADTNATQDLVADSDADERHYVSPLPPKRSWPEFIEE